MKNFALYCQQRGIALIPLCLIFMACGLWTEMEILVPSLPDMKHHFGLNDAQIQQLLTANFLGFFLGVLVAGPLCDTLGRKPMVLWGGLVYLLSCAACALTSDFSVLLMARFVQGVAMTGPTLAGGVLLFEHTSGERQIFWMALANSMVTFAMAASPIVGSWINSTWGFHGNLWCILAVGTLGIVPTLVWVPETLHEDNRKSLQLSELASGYWSLATDWRYMLLTLPICALAAGYYIYVGISSLYMVDYLKVEPALFARYQGPIVGCFSVVSLGASRLLKVFGLARSLFLGFVTMMLGCLPLVFLCVMGQESAMATTLCMMLIVGGMAPICALLFPYALNHLGQDLQGKAQALLQAFRLLLASLGTFFLGFVYSGPLLPVGVLLFMIIMLSSACLWRGRGYFKGEATENTGSFAH
jgi:DHA1 family bicyclomycin/chloramphenicol resistance-like MFS transporter